MPKKTNKEKKAKIKLAEESAFKSTKVKSTKAKSGGAKSSKSTKTPAEKRKAAMKKKYGNKKAVESQKSKEQRLSRQRRDKLTNQLASRVKQANEIVEDYGDYEHLQPVFADARRTLPPSRKKSEELFTADIKSEASMMRELARIDVFESQIRGRQDDDYMYIATGKNEKRQLTSAQQEKVTKIRRGLYKGAFGGQWMSRNEDHETYDKSRIVKEFAEEAFSIYSNLIERNPEDYIKMLWNEKYGKSMYDSENVIIAIYDMVASGWNREAINDRLDEVVHQLAKDYVPRQFENPMDYEPL